MKKRCNHFWELDFPVDSWERPRWRCMSCGTTKRDSIPVLDIGDFDAAAEKAEGAESQQLTGQSQNAG